MTVDTTWLWQLEGRDDPPGKHHHRFWRQLLLYLTGRDTESRGNVWVMTDQPRYSLPELRSRRGAIVATAGISDSQGNPVTDATCTLTLSGAGGEKKPLALRQRGDNYEAVIEAPAVGEYELELAAFRGGAQVGQARTRFVAYEPDVELEEPQADPRTMGEMARLSGGRAFEARQMGEMLQALLARDVPSRVLVEQRRALWDNVYVLLAFAGLLAGEWVLRKRWGLV